MKIKSYLLGKFKRNKILFFLLFFGLVATLLGAYYNTIRESKTTYHYAFRDSKDKTQGLFFQRNTDRNEDKNVVKEIFLFKKGSIVSLTSTDAYFISDSSKSDKVYKYNFNLETLTLFYENPKDNVILDLFLTNDTLFILEKSNLIKINLINNNKEYIEIKNLGVFNEFYEIKDQEMYLSYDNCKYIKESCNHEQTEKIFKINLTNRESGIVKIGETNFNQRTFFGTNKVYKLDTIKTYKDDEGNKNYNFRVFTQF